MSCLSVFAYGTLKKDQLRGSMWPHRPIRIEPAIALGQLWDLGSYPGLCPGSDWVLGELWTFHEQDMPRTLEVLDGIEGYDPSAQDGLYLRRMIEVRVDFDPKDFGTARNCFAYIIPDIHQWPKARRIDAWSPGMCPRMLAVWPDAYSRVPRNLSQEDFAEPL